MRRRRKSLKKFQGDTGTSEVTSIPGNTENWDTTETTTETDEGDSVINIPPMYTDSVGINTDVNMMNQMDLLALQNQELQNALLMQQLSEGVNIPAEESTSSIDLNDPNIRKIKKDKHGNIKKIKYRKQGGHIAKGKFLRQGGSTGRKLL